MAGVRSLFAFWGGGAGAPTDVAGVRSLFAFWSGGAAASSATDVAGVRGLFAFWSGGASASSAIVLFLLPDADVIDGGWTNELGGTVLYASIDESTVDDVDYIQSSVNPVADVCKISFSNPLNIVGAPVKVRYRYKKDGTPAADLTVRLLQGVIPISSWTHTGISTSFVTVEQTLSAPEFASITDFDDLFIEFEADS